ncbi:hypothetical protein PoB_006685400 [Plakobranchus ocellatus]|uniref:Uncharacterized protein n=1 Tax=Plakobranchus ocellatus TaxID=259542 RepID=A0AAV4D872_9GAST|nr:hypothetical protein PoB_006685400 [Plakobranchus ocellatus]
MKTRSARYSLSDYSRDRYHRWNNILDEVMSEIPGKDNYGGWLTDNTFGLSTADVYTQQTLNSAYYHRWYLMQENGAMGSNIGHRGFNDRNLFLAENSRPEIAGVTYNYCSSPNNEDTCVLQSKKVSYAFPLEIVYLTPLNKWNPYNLVHKGSANSPEGRTVFANGRNGGFTTGTAFNGTNSRIYYQTPSSFYGGGGEINSDAADTLKAFTGVLDAEGNVQNVTASGIRIHLPAIPGIEGNVRTRYPIMPIYGEGSTVWKELEALRTMLMDMQSNIPYFEKDPGVGECERFTETSG